MGAKKLLFVMLSFAVLVLDINVSQMTIFGIMVNELHLSDIGNFNMW